MIMAVISAQWTCNHGNSKALNGIFVHSAESFSDAGAPIKSSVSISTELGLVWPVHVQTVNICTHLFVVGN